MNKEPVAIAALIVAVAKLGLSFDHLAADKNTLLLAVVLAVVTFIARAKVTPNGSLPQAVFAELKSIDQTPAIKAAVHEALDEAKAQLPAGIVSAGTAAIDLIPRIDKDALKTSIADALHQAATDITTPPPADPTAAPADPEGPAPETPPAP